MPDNLTRMIQLADEFFETKNEPSQLTITEDVMEQLRSIHPATMGEISNENGPVAWTIVIPVTQRLKELFLTNKIGETELVTRTLEEMTRDQHLVLSSVYLCSVLVLPEFRGKGLAKELLSKSISAIRKDHPIENLFVWSFSAEGNGLAKCIAAAMDLPLLERSTG